MSTPTDDGFDIDEGTAIATGLFFLAMIAWPLAVALIGSLTDVITWLRG